MVRYVYFLILIVGWFSVHSQEVVTVIKIKELKKQFTSSGDTTLIFNFWATWCGPCVKEMPELIKMQTYCKTKNCKVIFISLDFAKDLAKVEKFVAKNNLFNVFLLDEVKYHEWIDLVDPSWGGAIPATLVLNNTQKSRKFYEKSITFDQLVEDVK